LLVERKRAGPPSRKGACVHWAPIAQKRGSDKLSMRCGAGSRFWRSGPRLLSSGVLWRSLVAACPTAATIAFLVLLPVAAILATAATRRPEQRQADYPAKAQTQELPATQGHSKNGIASGCRFSCLRHRGSPCLARFVTILTARRRLLVPELSHDSQHQPPLPIW